MNSRPSATLRQLNVLPAHVAAAYQHGLALALLDVVMVRPTGVGHAPTTDQMPIEGRDERIAAARRLA